MAKHKNRVCFLRFYLKAIYGDIFVYSKCSIVEHSYRFVNQGL